MHCIVCMQDFIMQIHVIVMACIMQVSVGVERYTNSTHIWSVLTLPHPTPRDSGLYQCTATDGNDERYCRSNQLPCVTTVTLSNEARVQIIGESWITVSVSNVTLMNI